jgi:hypothetical protein
MRARRTGALLALTCGLVLAAAASGVNTPLPGGTALGIAISSPPDGATLPLAPVTFSGSGSVGLGVATPSTRLIYVIDVSGSTGQQTASCPNQNAYDTTPDTTLDCELLALRLLNQQAVAAGTVGQIALVAFGGAASSPGAVTDAAVLDLSNGAPGTQSLVPPNATTFSPIPAHGPYFPIAGNDFEHVLQSAYVPVFGSVASPGAGFPSFTGGERDGFTRFTKVDLPGSTNYWAAITAVRNLITANPTTLQTHVVMLSDGVATVGGPSLLTSSIAQAMAGWPASVKVDTFAIGAGANCTSSSSSYYGSLQEISSRSGGVCRAILNPAAAATVVPSAIASKLTGITTTVDGTPTPTTITPALPLTGPNSASFTQSLNLAAGPHTLCADAAGSDGGGNGTAHTCVTVTIQAPPVVSLPGGPTAGTTPEGSPLTVSASADRGTTSWTEASGHCSFANAAAQSTMVTCDDNGVYTLTFTADDTVNPPVSRSQALTVTNVAPTAALSFSSGPHPLGAPVTATVAITDPGSADTHTCSIDWGDGSTPDTPAVSAGGCSASHTSATAGTKTVVATVTDDDGGVGKDTKTVAINQPPVVAVSPISGNEGAVIPLAFSATDADNDPLTNTWTATPGLGVDPGASCSFTATSVTCTDDGQWSISLSSSDGINPAVVRSTTLTVANVAPTVTITSPSAGANDRNVSFSAAVSDAANDTVTCTIDWGDGSAVQTLSPTAGACSTTHAYATSVKIATVTITATDDDGGSRSATRALSFNRPPNCTTVNAVPAVLWPPNGEFRLVVLVGATDPDGDAVKVTIDSVTQDEALGSAKTGREGDEDDERRGGKSKPRPKYDAVRLFGPFVAIRAARDGHGDGRVYTIGFTVTDSSGASCTGTDTVSVPHDRAHPAVLTPGVSVNSFGS